MAADELAICVPWRTDHGQRHRVWEACARRWGDLFPDSRLFLGTSHGQPFNRSAARNAAVEEFTRYRPNWDVVLLADADVMVYERQQVVEAVRQARRTGHMVFAHTWRAGLGQDATEQVLAGADPSGVVRDEWDANTFSGCYAVPRPLWDAVGGFDERFRSWGGEDLAFMRMCGAFQGVDRTEGVIYHLHHERPRTSQEEHPMYPTNWALWERYRDAGKDRDALRAIRFGDGG